MKLCKSNIPFLLFLILLVISNPTIHAMEIDSATNKDKIKQQVFDLARPLLLPSSLNEITREEAIEKIEKELTDRFKQFKELTSKRKTDHYAWRWREKTPGCTNPEGRALLSACFNTSNYPPNSNANEKKSGQFIVNHHIMAAILTELEKQMATTYSRRKKNAIPQIIAETIDQLLEGLQLQNVAIQQNEHSLIRLIDHNINRNTSYRPTELLQATVNAFLLPGLCQILIEEKKADATQISLFTLSNYLATLAAKTKTSEIKTPNFYSAVSTMLICLKNGASPYLNLPSTLTYCLEPFQSQYPEWFFSDSQWIFDRFTLRDLKWKKMHLCYKIKALRKQKYGERTFLSCSPPTPARCLYENQTRKSNPARQKNVK